MLHLTNGTAIIPLMRQAGIEGPMVPWDDVLHEGPVPAGLNPAALRQQRAEFLASCGWGSAEAIGRELADRDAALDGRGGRAAPRPSTRSCCGSSTISTISCTCCRFSTGSRWTAVRGSTAVPSATTIWVTQPAARFAGLFAARRRRHVGPAASPRAMRGPRFAPRIREHLSTCARESTNCLTCAPRFRVISHSFPRCGTACLAPSSRRSRRRQRVHERAATSTCALTSDARGRRVHGRRRVPRPHRFTPALVPPASQSEPSARDR